MPYELEFEQTLNPTYPKNVKEIPNIFFKTFQSSIKTSPGFEATISNRRNIPGGSDPLKEICEEEGIDYVSG